MSATWRGRLAAAWGIGGFVLVLLYALVRLSAIALESLAYAWQWPHYLALLANVVFMAWTEGYRGFQQSYSPRLAARALYLRRHATPAQTLLAPLVCMGFLDAPRRRIVAAWLLTLAIVAVVVVYRALPQPWRGILDAGVVVGLAWGIAATLGWACVVFRAGNSEIDPEMRPRAAEAG